MSSVKVPGLRRPRPPRSVRWLQRSPAGTDSRGTIEIRLGPRTTAYHCRALPTDFGPEYHGFELHKLDSGQQSTGVIYHVLVDLRRGWHCCDCLGHEAHGQCKHTAALAALCRSSRARQLS